MNLAKLADEVKQYIIQTTAPNVVQTKRLIGIAPEGGFIVELSDTRDTELVVFDAIYRDGVVRVRHIKSPDEGKKQVNFMLSDSAVNKLATLADLEKRSNTSMIEVLIDRAFENYYHTEE